MDRSAFDRIMQAGGFVSVRTGSAQDANALPVSKMNADSAMDAAACIGCGACVAACKNASAMLFCRAKVGQLDYLPQGQPERTAACSAWSAARRGRFRQLHQPVRMRGRLPEGNQRRCIAS